MNILRYTLFGFVMSKFHYIRNIVKTLYTHFVYIEMARKLEKYKVKMSKTNVQTAEGGQLDMP